MLELTVKERSILKRFFNTGGYVFNFSTSAFDAFTYKSIGIKLCEKYRLSKGKSLEAFIDEANTKLIILLTSDLLDYYEVYEDDLSEYAKKPDQLQQVRSILHNYEYLIDKLGPAPIDEDDVGTKRHFIAIQEISKEYQQQKTSLHNPMDESARRPRQFLVEAGAIT